MAAIVASLRSPSRFCDGCCGTGRNCELVVTMGGLDLAQMYDQVTGHAPSHCSSTNFSSLGNRHRYSTRDDISVDELTLNRSYAVSGEVLGPAPIASMSDSGGYARQ